MKKQNGFSEGIMFLVIIIGLLGFGVFSKLYLYPMYLAAEHKAMENSHQSISSTNQRVNIMKANIITVQEGIVNGTVDPIAGASQIRIFEANIIAAGGIIESKMGNK